MGTENPPHFACVAPFDGHIDTYRDRPTPAAFPGIIRPPGTIRCAPQRLSRPAAGSARSRGTIPPSVKRHPNYDAWWKERSAAEKLPADQGADVLDRRVEQGRSPPQRQHRRLPTRRRAEKAAGLRLVSNVYAAVADYSSIAFHEKYLLPFYDCYLKGRQTSYLRRAECALFRHRRRPVRDRAGRGRRATSPTRLLSRQRTRRGSVTSLNDGGLSARDARRRRRTTVFDYPNPGWRMGVVGVRTGRAARSGAPRAHLHHAAARSASSSRRADRAGALRRFDPQRHGFLRQALGTDGAGGATSANTASAALAHRHQGLAARVDARHRPKRSRPHAPYYAFAKPAAARPRPGL